MDPLLPESQSSPSADSTNPLAVTADSSNCLATGSVQATPKSPIDTPPSRSRPMPALVGAYEILEQNAVGGMGVVYKARHKSDGAIVALKMMREHIAGNAEHAQRFHREILAAARLRHANIMPILDVGWHDGKPFYTMPFRPGNLARLRQQQADIRAIVAAMEKVARGIQHAHEQDVLHRDLKLANVLLDEQGEPAVTDFGLAKLHDADLELTRTGVVMGTWPYMSPEQAAGRTRDLGPATDIWALGVMLYELLSGQRPFVGRDEEELRKKIQTAKPTPLRKIRPDVPWELETIVHRCLQRKPARRYLSAGALADDLRRWQLGERMPKPWPLPWVAALVLIAVVGVGVAAAAVYLRPARAPEGKAENGGPVPMPLVLIGADGPPKQFRWVAGARDGLVLASKAGEPFTLRSTGVSVMELLSDSPWPSYRFEAKVSHRNSEDGSAGIVVGHEFIKARDSAYSAFWHLGFAEEGRWRGSRSLAVASLGEAFSNAPIHTTELDFAPAPGQERMLAIEVDLAGIRSYWGQEKFALASAEALKNVQRPEAETVRGGIGLVVRKGEATFRHVIVRPLP